MSLFKDLAGQAAGQVLGKVLGTGGGGAGAPSKNIFETILSLIMSLGGGAASTAGGSTEAAKGGLGSGALSAGLAALLKLFEAKGLGKQAASWVSTGENLPITGDQLTSVLGDDRVNQFASSLGVSPKEASNTLADWMPKVVDMLTPGGNVPSDGLLQSGIGLLRKQFGF